jgi:hypothetical protein|tara:strand:+ start:9865 stop:10068 length:204 start_codon:yes stop_codon:yes gene_type:complete
MPVKFIPESPDPFLKTGADMAPAKFGHLNEILRMTQREFADDAAAIAAGLNVGELYNRPSGAVHVVK